MTWLIGALPECKTAANAAVREILAPLAQRGERLSGVPGERVAGVALEELLEAGGGARALAHRGAGKRGAELRVRGQRAARIRLDEGFERGGRLGELAGVGERLRVLPRHALVAAPVGLELGLGRFAAAQAGRHRGCSGRRIRARRERAACATGSARAA